MEINVKAVLNLMQTLGVSADDVCKALNFGEKPQSITAFSVRLAIEKGEISIKDIFPAQSNAWEKLIDFVASNDFTSSQKTLFQSNDEIEYAHTTNNMEYAKYHGRILGLVFSLGHGERFVFSLYNNARDLNINQAREQVAKLSPICGKKWIVPSDEHFRCLQHLTPHAINDALRELGGHEINRVGFLSTTSQHNCPHTWYVRFVLPL